MRGRDIMHGFPEHAQSAEFWLRVSASGTWTRRIDAEDAEERGDILAFTDGPGHRWSVTEDVYMNLLSSGEKNKQFIS